MNPIKVSGHDSYKADPERRPLYATATTEILDLTHVSRHMLMIVVSNTIQFRHACM